MNDLIQKVLSHAVELRHELHQHPQVMYQETYASELVQRELSRIGIPFESGFGETGVVGWIVPSDPDKAGRDAIALRADIDALAITEETSLEYESKFKGFMHACGHDGHTAILLGAAEVLWQKREEFPCPVKLIFQPAEEVGGGAKKLVEAGVLDETVGGVKVGMCFALHGWCDFELGQIVSKAGPIFAAPDTFSVKITGRGGHGAMPHKTADPIMAASKAVCALQSIVSRRVPPTEPAVVSVCFFNAGNAFNVIPQTAQFGGTTRSFSKPIQTLLHNSIKEIVTSTAAGFGCKADVEVELGYPVTVNDKSAVEHLKQTVGEKTYAVLSEPITVGEDFSYYAQKVPSCLFLLGIRDPQVSPEDFPQLHTSKFDFPDAAIEHGIKAMCNLFFLPD